MDERLQILINREWTHPVLDYVMAVFSSYDFWIPFLWIAGALIAWRGGFRGRAFLIVLGLVLGLLNFAVQIGKKSFDRPRPNQHLSNVRWIDLDQQTSPRFLALGKPLFEKINAEPLPVARGNGRSFPSGHVVNLFGAATVTAAFFRRRGWLAFLPATLTAYSRVYTGAHHPSDVVVTAFFATSAALLLLAAFLALWQGLGARFAPRLLARHPALFGPATA